MKIDWAIVFTLGLFLIGVALSILIVILVIPWVVMNWLLSIGITVLVGLTMIVVAYYMDFVRVDKKGLIDEHQETTHKSLRLFLLPLISTLGILGMAITGYASNHQALVTAIGFTIFGWFLGFIWTLAAVVYSRDSTGD